MRTRFSFVALATLLGCASTPQRAPHDDPHPHSVSHSTSDHRFSDAERWAAVFEAPERDAWQMPEKVIAALEIPKGARVADIGSATGYFPIRIARAHPDALVYGVDVEPEMVAYLEHRARDEKLPNVKSVQGEALDPALPEAVDLVLLVNTYHHVEARPAYFSRLKLRPGARVAIVDFRPGSKMGPPHKLASDTVRSEMEQAGYRLAVEHDFLPEQYFLIFERNEATK